MGIVEFYTHLCALFGLEPYHRRAAMFRDIKEHVLTMNGTAHVHPVLLIDQCEVRCNAELAT